MPHLIYFALHLIYFAKITSLLHFRGTRLQPHPSHRGPGILLSSLRTERVFLGFWLSNKKTKKICHITNAHHQTDWRFYFKKKKKKSIRSILQNTGIRKPKIHGRSSSANHAASKRARGSRNTRRWSTLQDGLRAGGAPYRDLCVSLQAGRC